MLGPVKVVPPWTEPALRRNMAAIGKHGQARSANSKCPRFQGNPDLIGVFHNHGRLAEHPLSPAVRRVDPVAAAVPGPQAEALRRRAHELVNQVR